MITIDIENILSWDPCDAYDTAEKIEAVAGSGPWMPAEVLRLNITHDNMMWVLQRCGLPAVVWSSWVRWCALQVIDLWDAPEIVRQYLETGLDFLQPAVGAIVWYAMNVNDNGSDGVVVGSREWATMLAVRTAAWAAVINAREDVKWYARDAIIAAAVAARAAGWAAGKPRIVAYGIAGIARDNDYTNAQDLMQRLQRQRLLELIER